MIIGGVLYEAVETMCDGERVRLGEKGLYTGCRTGD